MSCKLNTIAKSNCKMARQIMMLWKYNTHCITDNICPSSIFRVINLLSPRKLCQTLLLRNRPEQLNPSTKKAGVLNCKCLGLYVTRQLIWRHQGLGQGDFILTCSQSACGSAAKKLRMYSIRQLIPLATQVNPLFKSKMNGEKCKCRKLERQWHTSVSLVCL